MCLAVRINDVISNVGMSGMSPSLSNLKKNNFSLLESEPMRQHPEELRYEWGKKYFCGFNIDGATARSLRMKIFTHVLHFQVRLRHRFVSHLSVVRSHSRMLVARTACFCRGSVQFSSRSYLSFRESLSALNPSSKVYSSYRSHRKDSNF